MITSKQRARLRAMANGMDVILQIGKAGVTEEVAAGVSEALLKRELIKIRVLENSDVTAREAAVEISEATLSNVVQVVGSCIVLYKQNPKQPVIKL